MAARPRKRARHCPHAEARADRRGDRVAGGVPGVVEIEELGTLSHQPLAAFFASRSVAVIGASRDPAKVGGSVLANLLSAGFDGVVPVNARAGTVQGLPAVPSMLEIEGPVAALAGTIAGFSRLVVDEPALSELEINPLIASAFGIIAVDARASLAAAAI